MKDSAMKFLYKSTENEHHNLKIPRLKVIGAQDGGLKTGQKKRYLIVIILVDS